MHVKVVSPFKTEYNVVNGAILLKIDTNYVVPNLKYSATAEIEKNNACNGCYTVYVILHTPATPGCAWEPQKLAPILAVIRPGATERNVTIHVVPLGALQNAANRGVALARCSYLAAQIMHLRAEVAVCNALGCNTREKQEIWKEWNTIYTNNIKMRCNLNVEKPEIATPSANGGALRRYVSKDENVVSITKKGDKTIIKTERSGKLFGIFPVSVESTIVINGHSVTINRPLWYSLFGWLVW